MLLTLSQKGHAKFVFSCPYLVQVAPIEWIVYLQLHLQPLNVWTLLVNQSISFSICYQSWKTDLYLVGYYKSRLFWFPEKYQKSNLWELGGLTAAALSYSWRIFTWAFALRVIHTRQPLVNNNNGSKNGSVLNYSNNF